MACFRMISISPLDLIALSYFIIIWAAYSWLVERSCLRSRSIAAVMGQYRLQWMSAMAKRDMRMLDSQLQSALMQGVSFLASTAVLMVGVLTAMLGLPDAALDISHLLPPEMVVETVHWKAKVLLVSAVFVFAFFKLLWCYRLFNYCAILIGATAEVDNEVTQIHIKRIAAIHVQAGDHFNAGLRGFYFAVASIGWLLHPLALVTLVTLVAMVLARRDFASRSLSILRGDFDT